MRMSIRTTSGRSSRAARTPAAPSPASPTTSKPPDRLEHRAQPEPHQLLVVDQQHPDGSSCRQHRLDREAAVQPRLGAEPAAQGAHPLAQPHQAVARRRRRLIGASRRGPLTTRTDELVGRPLDASTQTAAPGRVLAAVGQRLLHDPVGGPADRRGRRRPPGSPRSSTVMPASRDCATSRGRSSSPGCGPSGRPRRRRRRAARRPSGAARRAPGGRRSAPARRAAPPGRRSAAAISIAPACSTIRLTRWPTASCISRAMRVRSVRTASRASSSRSASARSARSRSAATSSARVRAQTPSAPGEHHRQRGAAPTAPIQLVERRPASHGRRAASRIPIPRGDGQDRPAAHVPADRVGGHQTAIAQAGGERRRARRPRRTGRAVPSGGRGAAATPETPPPTITQPSRAAPRSSRRPRRSIPTATVPSTAMCSLEPHAAPPRPGHRRSRSLMRRSVCRRRPLAGSPAGGLSDVNFRMTSERRPDRGSAAPGRRGSVAVPGIVVAPRPERPVERRPP